MKTRGLGRVYLRGSVWWIQYSFRGKVHRESSHSADGGDAVKLLRRRLGEMGLGRLVGQDAERTTFEYLAQMVIDDYRVNRRKSERRAQEVIARLRTFFGMSRALEITSDRITAYIRFREEDPKPPQPATIKYELAVLKRMFTLAMRAGRLAQRPYIPSIEVRNTRTGFFEPSEFQKVLNRLSEEVKPVAEFAYLTGWRRGEILALEWRQVDLKAGTVRLDPGCTKNDEGRTFPFRALPALAALLERQSAATTALERESGQIIPWVFHRAGRRLEDFRTQWARACREAGVPERLFHDLRRTAVRNLERAGVPRSVAMKLTGHKTESVYRRYAIVSEADLAEGVSKLALLHGRPAAVIPKRTTGTVLAQFSQLRDTDDARSNRHRPSNELKTREKKVVPKGGVEPPRGCPQRILSPPCLPFHHFGFTGWRYGAICCVAAADAPPHVHLSTLRGVVLAAPCV